eukprot:scaffold215667_cov34-Tisochrysis_lutea.AAC.2
MQSNPRNPFVTRMVNGKEDSVRKAYQIALHAPCAPAAETCPAAQDGPILSAPPAGRAGRPKGNQRRGRCGVDRAS